MKRQGGQEEHQEHAPLWILSFGDMITNFLAFFILMQSFCTSQRAELLQTGEGLKSSAIAELGGLPKWLAGSRMGPEFAARRRGHAVESDPDNVAPERIIDAEDEAIRKLFDDLRRSSDTRTSNARRGYVRLVTAPIAFAAGRADLNPEGMDYLSTLAAELGQSPGAAKADIYVYGAAPDAAAPRDRYVLSARRAQAVRDALARNLGGDGAARRIVGRGIGAGVAGPIAGPAAPPAIVIAVVETAGEE